MHNQNGKIIAEIGSVHDGSFGNALKLIELAATLGADVAKFQTHIAEAETLQNAPSPAYFKAESRFEYFKRTAFSEPQWRMLKEHCDSLKIEFLSSPFSNEAVDLLERIGVNAYKIPSGEVTNIPLLEKLARTQKKIYLSSGMSCWDELDTAVSILKQGGPLIIMQCTSAYPCPLEQVGINVIREMQQRYNLPVGFSDHTQGIAASAAAVSIGAVAVEKHLTYSKKMYGSDAANAMEPEEFKTFCQTLRDIWTMLASPVDKNNNEMFKEMKLIFEKSIVTARPLHKGEIIQKEDLSFKKPGNGMAPFKLSEIVGRRTTVALPINHQLRETDFI